MTEFINTLTSLNWPEWLGVLAAFVVAFEKLALLTPTDADNKIVAGAYKVFAVLGLKFPDRGNTPKEPTVEPTKE